MTPTTPLTLHWRDPQTGESQVQTAVYPLTIGRSPDNTIQLNSSFVSSHHLRIEDNDRQAWLRDLGSRNGTKLNGKLVGKTAVLLTTPSHIEIGPYSLHLTQPPGDGRTATLTNLLDPATLAAIRQSYQQPAPALAFSSASDALEATSNHEPTPLPPIFQQRVVPLAALNQPYESKTYLSVGGGLGSFAWINHLVVYGADPSDILTIGFEPKPYGRYQRLCRNSQIPDHERLRSNSDSCPDNLWGWPGYGVREIWGAVKNGRFSHAATIGWQLFNEPYIQTYTPVAGHVFAAIDREAERIGWGQLWRHGRVRAIRQTDDGRYLVAYTHLRDGQPDQHRLVVCRYLHLAVGYPGVRFLPDLQAYRAQSGDFRRVVNAYEAHDHVYDALAQQGGTVLIRGRGIVASRIIQRLHELRAQHGSPIAILHLMRQPLAEGQQFDHAQREVSNHWEFQPFNWPKAAWGGDLRQQLEQASDEERKELLACWGGTTTADRHDWRRMVDDGLREGWYEIRFGAVQGVEAAENGRLSLTLQRDTTLTHQTSLEADFIIDATGLEAGLESNGLLRDLVNQYDLPRNARGGLQVSNAFEVEALRHGEGRVYASGIVTLGGPFAAVDSFLGLQFAALRSVDQLTAVRATGLRRLDGLRSLNQWTRWAIGAKP
ncbi:MAG: FHA domain-containing protein [Anaerolineales bacterium]|nr:FHA domain-containing protein [Anaerolineales bacterium]